MSSFKEILLHEEDVDKILEELKKKYFITEHGDFSTSFTKIMNKRALKINSTPFSQDDKTFIYKEFRITSVDIESHLIFHILL